MTVRGRRWRNGLAALGIACALVLVPSAAFAQDGDPDPNLLNLGLPYAVAGDGSHATIASIGSSSGYGCADSDDSCHYVVIGMNGEPALADGTGATVAYLDTTGTSHVHVENIPGYAPSGGAPAGYPAGTWFLRLSVTPGHFAGLTCFGYGDNTPGQGSIAAGATATPDQQGPCHANDNLNGHFGQPRAGLDMGHAGTPGFDSGLQPGQKSDGTIDIADCINDIDAGESVLSPATIVAPLRCVALWAFTPPTDLFSTLTTQQASAWNATQLGATLNAVNFYSAIDPDSSCDGVAYNFDFLHVPGNPALPKPGNFLAACAGSDLGDHVAPLVKLSLTFAVLIGAAFKVFRMISAFIKGPQLDAGADWEDPRLF